MATIILDYDNRNALAKQMLEDILALGFFKLRTSEKLQEEVIHLSGGKEDEFIYSVSEQVLAKDWMNKIEDDAWKNL
jgi:hypothetical protein